MVMLIPHSNGEDASPLHEFNSCHSPDDGKFCSGSKFSAGKMPMEGRAPNGYGISVHVSHNHIQVDAGPRTIANLMFLDGHKPGKLTKVTTSQVASEFQRKGWGAWLYKRAAQAAIEAGAAGIWSSGHSRNHLSDRVWAALERKGLAEKLESKGGRDIYRMPPAGGVKKLHEANPCHSPENGRFCSGAGSFAMSGLDDTSAPRMLDKGAVWYSFEQGGDWRATHAGSVTITPTLQRKITGLYSPARGTSQVALLKRALDVPERKGYLTVYRIAKSGASLDNRNAANLMGIATFMNQSIGDGRSLTGLSLHAYYVKTKGTIAEGPRHYKSFDRETR
jgi:GNAT superfamily N-acetyltransferase